MLNADNNEYGFKTNRCNKQQQQQQKKQIARAAHFFF